jgi:hypothetical protein
MEDRLSEFKMLQRATGGLKQLPFSKPPVAQQTSQANTLSTLHNKIQSIYIQSLPIQQAVIAAGIVGSIPGQSTPQQLENVVVVAETTPIVVTESAPLAVSEVAQIVPTVSIEAALVVGSDTTSIPVVDNSNDAATVEPGRVSSSIDNQSNIPVA